MIYSHLITKNTCKIYRVYPSQRGTKEWTIIGRGLSKYSNISMASRSIICLSLWLRLDLLTTDNSQCFTITEFKTCVTIIRSPSLFSNIIKLNHSAIFQTRGWFLLVRISRIMIICKWIKFIITFIIKLNVTSHEQTVIWSKIFAAHVVGSRSIKKDGKNYGMLMPGITLTLCPRACAYFRNTLIAPVNWIWLVRGKAVAVNEARVTLYAWKEKRVRQNISSQKF